MAQQSQIGVGYNDLVKSAGKIAPPWRPEPHAADNACVLRA